MAKKKTRKISATRKEYNRQRKRIQNFLSRARKQGYIFDEGVLPQIPRRVTKASVSRLAKLTAKELYKKAVYVSRETGEIETPEDHKKKIRKEAQQKAKETKARKKQQAKKKQNYPKPKSNKKREKKVNTDTSFYTRAVIETFLYTLETCRNGKAYGQLLRWFNKLRSDNGDDAVSHMLTKAAENGYEISWSVVYNVEKADDFVHGVIQYLSTQGDFYRDQMDDFWDELSSMENAMFEDSNFTEY